MEIRRAEQKVLGFREGKGFSALCVLAIAFRGGYVDTFRGCVPNARPAWRPEQDLSGQPHGSSSWQGDWTSSLNSCRLMSHCWPHTHCWVSYQRSGLAASDGDDRLPNRLAIAVCREVLDDRCRQRRGLPVDAEYVAAISASLKEAHRTCLDDS